jgi:DNA mismatch repair protein MutS
LANDNFFKGLSTFVVEMSELRVILKMADENSLILGDELCSGTETESALSIFVAGLTTLTQKKSSFIFATHFHEIVRFEEVTQLLTLRQMHMAVHYDRETDALVYDRLLRDGPGDRMYGLEVCKSLHLPQEFLEMAYRLRTKYFPAARGDLQHAPSVYNSHKIRGMCEICGQQMSTETHHMMPQRLADAEGFITTERGTFHKNHAANLKSVCEACHGELHSRKKKCAGK